MTLAVNARFLLHNQLEGVGWFTYEVLRRLVEWHPSYRFIFLFDRPFHQRFIFADNVTPLVLYPPARHPFLFYYWFEYAVYRALKKYRADAFLSTDGFLCLRTQVPTLLVIHDLAHVHFPNQVRYLEQKYYNYFMPRFAQKASRIATVSEFSKLDIQQQYQIPESQIDVVYNGARANFKPISKEKQKTIKQQYSNGKDYFFYIGSVHPRKNIHRLIAAFDRFKAKTNAPLQLLIAGRLAWQTSEVQNVYNHAIYQNDIQFLGYVPDEVVPLLMSSAFAFTYISQFEGFGIPLLEAMNCEIPIITANVSSMPEVVGDAGLKVNPNSIDSIIEAMMLLYKNEDVGRELSAEAKVQRQKFSWDWTAQQLDGSLEKIVRD